MFLTQPQLSEIIQFRHTLHRNPEVSGEERETARAVVAFLETSAPDRIVTSLGGHGVAAVYDGRDAGPTIMIRSELDGLPIEEISDLSYRSIVPGKGHLCGHDGHSATLAALAVGLGQNRPAKGRVVLLFQPSEENGAGAAAVIADPQFDTITPDLVLSTHNFPGLPLGYVALKEGAVNCATRGMKIVFGGKTAHAASPEEGVAPTLAIASLLKSLTELTTGTVVDEDFLQATITHTVIGSENFGISPARGEIWVTLRTLTDERMQSLMADAEELVRAAAATASLTSNITYHQIFLQCFNADAAVSELRRAVDQLGLDHGRCENLLPIRPGEDFGLFRRAAPSAMFFLGAGEDHPGLHNPDYDFPDALIEVASDIFMQTIRNMLGTAPQALEKMK